jgi:hypothetical protein
VQRFLLVWAGLALAVSLSGVFESPPVFLVPLVIWSGPIAFVTAYAKSRRFREAMLGLDLRPAVLFHLVRVVAGAAFLVLHQRGELPGAFALKAGWGDIVVGLAALPAALALPARTPARRWGVLAWNVAALLDILMVVAMASRLMLFNEDPSVLAVMSRFPMSLLPLFVVPLVLITHFLVMARLWKPRPEHPRQDA